MSIRTLIVTALSAVLLIGLVPAAVAAPADGDTRIVGGEDAEEGAYPWNTALLINTPAGTRLCGASLIASEWLLTAAHCVDDVAPEDVGASIGEHDISDPSGEIRTGVDIILHPDWDVTDDDPSQSGDIALIQMDDPVEDVQPIALPVPADDPNYAPGETVRAIGWGTTEEGGDISEILQQVDLDRVDDQICVDNYGVTDGIFTVDPAIQICAGVEGGGQDACQGDSGGPLFVEDSFGFPVHVGVTSFGLGCAREDFPGVWTRTSAYADWIVDQGVDFEPIAVAGGPYEAFEGTPFTLDAAGSRVGPTDELTYEWDLSDLDQDDVEGPTPEITIDEIGTYEVTLTVTDVDGASDSDTATITVEEAVDVFETLRIEGANRFETAANVARETFPEGADLVVIATAADFPDALAASPRAAREGAPLLLTTVDEMPAETVQALEDLDTVEALIVGGTAAISDAIEDQLDALGIESSRIGGDDRTDTAIQLARAGWRQADTVYLATAFNFPDALAGAAAAGFDDAPLLLSATDEIPANVQEAIAELEPSEIVLLGGPVALSANVEAQAQTLAETVTRYGGAERMETAALIAARFPDFNSAWIATGYAFPDALVAGPGAAAEGGPLLLVNPDLLPPATASALGANEPMRLVVVGGEAAVNTSVLNAAANAAGHPQ